MIYIPPTYNTLALIETLHPSTVAYINNFNYNASAVMKDLLKSELELLSRCDALFGLSDFCVNRLRILDSRRKVYQCPPGVDYAAFRKAFRGNESVAVKSVYYFGGIGPHLDFSIYDAIIDAGMRVVMDGEVDPAIRGNLNPKYELHPPTPHSELPDLLADADCLLLAYKNSPYMRGVFPAKFFECLATGKPVLVSGLPETSPYGEIIYDIGGSAQKALDVIRSLRETETPLLLQKRDEIAKAADWQRRFEDFFVNLNDAWVEKRGIS